MARDYLVEIVLDDEKIKKFGETGLGDHITEIDGKKAIKVTLPQKNQRKFAKAFSKAVLDEQTGEVQDFPEDAVNTLFDKRFKNRTVSFPFIGYVSL